MTRGFWNRWLALIWSSDAHGIGTIRHAAIRRRRVNRAPAAATIVAGWRGLALVGAFLLLEQYGAESTKAIFARPRPSRDLIAVAGTPTGFTFPSTTITFFCATFGAVAVLAARRRTARWRWPILAVSAAMVGLGCLVSRELLFSTWVWVALLKLEAVYAVARGLDIPGMPFVDEQAQGAYLALAGFLLWTLLWTRSGGRGVRLPGNVSGSAASRSYLSASGDGLLVSRRAATRAYTFGFQRAEDLAGVFIVLVIVASAVAAGWESVSKFMSGQAPMMQGLMGNYLEQSKNLFLQMQEQFQSAGNIFPGMPGFPPQPPKK